MSASAFQIVAPATVRLWQLFVVAGLFSVLAIAVLPSLIREWAGGHGWYFAFLVIPIAAWIVGRRVRRFGAAPAKPESLGIVAVALSCLLFVAARASIELFTSRISLVFLALSLVLTFGGYQYLRLVFLPLLTVAATIPLPSLIYNPLSAPVYIGLAEAASAALRFLGTTVYHSGNVVAVDAMTVSMPGVLSAVRSLPAAVLVSLLITGEFSVPPGLRVVAAATTAVSGLLILTTQLIAGLRLADALSPNATAVLRFPWDLPILAVALLISAAMICVRRSA